MEEQLRLAIKLQTVESRRRSIQAEIEAIPRHLEQLLARAQEHEAAVSQAKAAIESDRKERRRLEVDIEGIKAKIAKYREQLMAVKTNKEYSALLHEIEEANGHIRTIEDKVLDLMEREETLAKELGEKEAALAAEHEEAERERRKAAGAEGGLKTDLESLDRDREALRGALDKEILGHFDKVFPLRGWLAVVAVKNGNCDGCRVRVRPQVLAEMRRWERMHLCENCKRILYHEEPAPEDATQPSSPKEVANPT